MILPPALRPSCKGDAKTTKFSFPVHQNFLEGRIPSQRGSKPLYAHQEITISQFATRISFQPQQKNQNATILLRFSPLRLLQLVQREISSEGERLLLLVGISSLRISAMEGLYSHRAARLMHPTGNLPASPICLFPWKSNPFIHSQMYKSSLPISFGHLAIAFCMAHHETPTLYLCLMLNLCGA